ncbi:MAG: tetratricopeptide repeat protein [Planctomycetota bacterium]
MSSHDPEEPPPTGSHGAGSSGTSWYVEDLSAECVQFQIDLSCLVDGELDEVASARAITHLEGCAACGEFFDDVRMQVRAHRDLSDPEALVARYGQLVGSAGAAGEAPELVRKLGTIFYQLGKAYVLTGTDPGFRERVFQHTRVFERAVPLQPTKNRGRGFVDGVLESGRSGAGSVDWVHARHLFNGRLESIENPLEKGQRLLQEAVAADPTNEEARLYLAFLDAKEGKKLRAANQFRQVFRTGRSSANRAHAAIQLGLLYEEEGEYRKAIACCRWVTISGAEARDARFFFVRFNIGMYYAHLAERERSLRAFRGLIDHHPDRVAEIVRLFGRSPGLRAAIDAQPGFGEALVARCPEIFTAPLDDSDSGTESEEAVQ